MSANQQHLESTEADLQLRLAIGKNVVLSLGQPKGLLKVQVSCLWANHYRVNILIGMDAASAKVAHSYFLVCDLDGTVVQSSPAITKQY
jgi:hypothetical protein